MMLFIWQFSFQISDISFQVFSFFGSCSAYITNLMNSFSTNFMVSYFIWHIHWTWLNFFPIWRKVLFNSYSIVHTKMIFIQSNSLVTSWDTLNEFLSPITPFSLIAWQNLTLAAKTNYELYHQLHNLFSSS